MLDQKIIDNPPFIPAKYFHKGRNLPVQLIVIHTMEAPEKGETAENIAKYFARGERVASAHYCIDNNSIVQCVWDRDTAFACPKANANGVQLEHAGYAKQSANDWADQYSLDMLNNSAQIAAYLCKKFKLPTQRAEFAGEFNPRVTSPGFCGHADVPLHGTHWDPGASFPWEFYLDLVRVFLKAK